MPLASALKRSWLLLVVSVLLCAGVGVAAGLLRTPEYKAESQLFVGSFDVRSVAVPGFVTASVQLADAYSRLASSDAVVVPVSRRVGLSPDEVDRRLTTSNIPGSPVVRLDAVGSSRRAALRLVRAATNETVARIRGLTVRTAEADRVLGQFQAAAAAAQKAESRAALLRARRDGGQAIRRQTIIDAQTKAETARLRATALGNLYGEARANSRGAAQAHVIRAAVSASDDRSEVLQRLILLGAAAGLVLGAALAALHQRRLLRDQ
jgi:uncharacterized protein involved in exopolysaccharide biosynthesis